MSKDIELLHEKVMLYIPHSSDKTGQINQLLDPLPYFTSHIVQIKPVSTLPVSKEPSPLHPT